MKKFLLTLLFVSILPQMSFAQEDDYWPFLEEGKRWVYDYVDYYPKEWIGEITYFLSDIEELGVLTKECSVNVTFVDTTYCEATLTETISNNPIRWVYIREKKEDYVYDSNLYDFGLKNEEGYVLTISPFGAGWRAPLVWKQEDCKEVTIRGRKTRVHILVKPFNYTSQSRVQSSNEKQYHFEGIGTIHGISPVSFGSFGSRSMLFKACYVGDELVATYDDLLAAIEEIEGASAVEEIKAERERVIKEGLYDLQGRRLSAEPSHGIYIKDGKKIAR